MNNDNFAEAARAEAEKRHQGDWDPFEQEPVDDWGFAEAERRAFVTGAEWARTYLAAQEPTEADSLIDVAMDAYAEASGQSVSRSWMVAALDAVAAARAARRDEEGRP